MKIGILTFHRADNFGAALQTFALQKFLIDNGHNAFVIDYRCKKIEEVYYIISPKILFSRKNIIKAINSYMKNLFVFKEMHEKHKKYEIFRHEYLNLTESFYKIKNDLDFDAYIAGSDQIWNFALLGGINKYYLLDFPIKDEALKISFSASSEIAAFPLFIKNQDKIKRCLKDFDFISVRELFLKEELYKYTNKEISVTLDPTFLIRKEIYDKILIRPKENQYVLIYHMAETNEAIELAKQIAISNNTNKIIQIHASFKSPKGKNHKRDLGPLEILGYIKYANAIVTNSFHGAALSIILEKNFWVINTYKSSRLKSLLNNAGLESRYIKSISDYKCEDIDYNLVNSKLNPAIEYSKQFIINALNNKK